MPHRDLIVKLSLMAAGMFVFGFALIPLYDVFCDLTGLGGRTAAGPRVVAESVDETRSVRVEFVANVGGGAPWEFEPGMSSMAVHPGKLYETHYFARNLTQRALVGHAVPSVAPGLAARHFRKIECFCFTEQSFEAAESRDMGVRFMVSPELPAHIDTLTLSYTFYARPDVAQH